MNVHKYTLEPYKGMNTRYPCPECNGSNGKSFSLYIDTETGEHLHPSVGRCNRESNCGYYYSPKQYFQDNNISFDAPHHKTYKPRLVTPLPKQVSFIPIDVFKASLKAHETNHFVEFIIKLFGVEVASKLISRYFIGTSKYWNGATVFWQIDKVGKIRTGKIMLYSPTTGKRAKNLEQPVYWVHKAIKQPEFELKQCFFGEHLLNEKDKFGIFKPIAIVESEKTAIILSVYLPNFIWLAVGSISNLNAEKCSVLKGRTVTLFPDLNAFEKWSSKAKELSHLANFSVSDLLERKATEFERKEGLDLADYVINFDFESFVSSKADATLPPEAVQTLVDIKPMKEVAPFLHFKMPEAPQQAKWLKDISKLETYFATIILPSQPIRLNRCSTIMDCSKFVESHLSILRKNPNKKDISNYIERLLELKFVLKSNP